MLKFFLAIKEQLFYITMEFLFHKEMIMLRMDYLNNGSIRLLKKKVINSQIDHHIILLLLSFTEVMVFSTNQKVQNNQINNQYKSEDSKAT